MATAARHPLNQVPASQSAVLSLKTLFSILMGLSVTNTLVILIRRGEQSSVLSPASIGHDALPLTVSVALLFTIFRFYLGNIRHVDDLYVNAPPNALDHGASANTAARFTADLTVVLLEALIFGIASFYVLHAANFTELLMVVLVIDILWTASQGVSRHQSFWLINNLAHLFAISICFGFHIKYPHSVLPFYFAVGLLLTNGLADVMGNRHFYFAAGKKGQSAFLSAPLTQLLGEEGLPLEFRKRLTTVINHLEAIGWSVGNAHKRENWGMELDSPFKALRADLEGVEEADVLIAMVGSPPSPGVQFELGFALAKGKKILLIDDAAGEMPYLMDGLMDHESTVLLRVGSATEDDHDFAEAISASLTKLTGTTA
jgi:hypothetical protein